MELQISLFEIYGERTILLASDGDGYRVVGSIDNGYLVAANHAICAAIFPQQERAAQKPRGMSLAEEAVRLRRSGLRRSEIALKLSVSQSAVSRWLVSSPAGGHA